MEQTMDNEIFFAIVDQYKYAVVFVDNDHIIRYMNQAAQKRYEARGGAALVNKSIFDCHNEKSKGDILKYHQQFLAGENEVFLVISKAGEKTTMVAVRSRNGELLGYYERFEAV